MINRLTVSVLALVQASGVVAYAADKQGSPQTAKAKAPVATGSATAKPTTVPDLDAPVLKLTPEAAAKQQSKPAKSDAHPAKSQVPAGQKAAPTTTATGAQAKPADPKATTKKAEPVLTSWSEAELAEAKARCNSVLKKLNAVTIPEAPFRSGACGAAAPMRVVSIGKNPEVTLSPPAVMSCDLLAGLDEWLRTSVQPSAKKHLGEPIIGIGVMSDYSCRAAYGRVGNRLSEHGRANALDIRGFITAKGQAAVVLADWGKTARDIAREVAAAKAEAEKAQQKIGPQNDAPSKPSPGLAPKAPSQTAPSPQVASPAPAVAEPQDNAASDLATGAVDAIRSIVKSTIIEGQGSSSEPAFTSHGLAPPSRLGGPKDKATEKQQTKTAAVGPGTGDNPVIVSSRKSRFLREVHASACRIFGTALGPEANQAHRNHLHVDMAQRRSKFCR